MHSLEDVVLNYIQQNDPNYEGSQQMLEELSDFAKDDSQIQTVIKQKGDESEYKEINRKNIELGEIG